MSQPLAWAGAAMVLGAWSWPWWQPTLTPLTAGAVALAALALLARGHRSAHGAWLAAAFLLGNAACAALPSPVLPRDGRVSGLVTRVSGLDAVLATPSGALRLRFPDGPPRAGTRLAAWVSGSGESAALPGSPNRARDDLRAHQRRARVRRWVRLGPEEAPRPDLFPEAQHRGLLTALVRGDRSQIPADELHLFQATGTAHLLAISGLHVGMIAAAAASLTALLLRPLAFSTWPRLVGALPNAVAIGAAWAYAAAVGWPISATRAAWMLGAGALGRAFGRRPQIWNLLGLAAAAAVLSEPGVIAEPAFLLSFGSVVGILLVAPRFTRLVPPDAPRALVWTVGALGTTLGATAGTLPLTAWLFQDLPISSPLANLLAGPLVGAVVVPSALLAAATPGRLGALALWVADRAAHLVLRILGLLAIGDWHPAVGPVGALALALALPLRRHPAAAGGLALLALGLACWPTAPLTVTFLSVGQGDAAAIAWPDGRWWLVDGGPPSDQVLHWLRRQGVRRLDAVFLSHPDADHRGGLQPVLEELPVDTLWAPRMPSAEEPEYLALWSAAAAQGAKIRLPGPDDPAGATLIRPAALPGARLKGENDQGLVLVVRVGAQRLLFTGDISAAAESRLLPVLGPMTVVKVPHHGSRSSSSEALIRATQPALAVISVGASNTFGHPAPEVLARWAGTPLLRTDRDGTVELSLDGADVRARSWRPDQGWRPLNPQATPPRAPAGWETGRATSTKKASSRRPRRRAHGSR